MQTDPVQTRIEKRYRTMLILWAAFIMAVGFYFLISLFISPVGESGEEGPVLVWALLAVALMMLVVSFALKKRLHAQSIERQNLALAQTGLIVALALCEAAALFGLLAHLLTGTRYSYVFFIMAVCGMVAHRPRRDDLWLAASRKG